MDHRGWVASSLLSPGGPQLGSLLPPSMETGSQSKSNCPMRQEPAHITSSLTLFTGLSDIPGKGHPGMSLLRTVKKLAAILKVPQVSQFKHLMSLTFFFGYFLPLALTYYINRGWRFGSSERVPASQARSPFKPVWN
jgi:hypothetical protein